MVLDSVRRLSEFDVGSVRLSGVERMLFFVSHSPRNIVEGAALISSASLGQLAAKLVEREAG